MRFPDWVDGNKRTTKAKRASARLKFMLSAIALEKTGARGMRKLSTLVGLDYSTFYKYITAGAFSFTAAQKIEDVLGKKTIRAAYLTNPLDITST